MGKLSIYGLLLTNLLTTGCFGDVKKEAKEAIREARKATQEFRDVTQQLKEILGEVKKRKIIEKGEKALESMPRMEKSIKALTEKMPQGGVLGKLENAFSK